MAETPAFEWTADAVEAATELSRIEARGTVRLVLKEAGLEPSSVNGQQMQVVLKRLMPAALDRRRVEDAEALCNQLAEKLSRQSLGGASRESAHDVFARLGGRRRK